MATSWCLLTDVGVSAKSAGTVKGRCTAQSDIDLVVIGSHAHHHLQRFEQRFYDGSRVVEEPFYVSTQWDSPEIVVLEEPMRIRQGQGIEITCVYENTFDTPIVYGTGGRDGEMCLSLALYAYPPERANETPPSIAGLVVIRGTSSPLYPGTLSE